MDESDGSTDLTDYESDNTDQRLLETVTTVQPKPIRPPKKVKSRVTPRTTFKLDTQEGLHKIADNLTRIMRPID